MFGLNAMRKTLGAVALAASKVPAVEEKFKIRDRICGPFPQGPLFWMHGASLGECKMLLALAKILQKDIPEIPQILITTQKVEVLDFLKPIAEKSSIQMALAPLDTQSAMKNFMSAVKPVMLILAENELWPGYLMAMRNAFSEPRIALVSGRFYRCVDTAEFPAIGFVSMQSGADLTRFVAAGDYAVSAKTLVGGDWKLLPWAKSATEIKKIENAPVDTTFLSFHREELSALITMLKMAMQKNETVVLAPRFEEEVSELNEVLLREKIPTVKFPELKKGAVSVVTEYGRLTEVLNLSKSSIIGGSFLFSLGVHDFWESLKLGVATCIGPHYRGQQAAVEALLREGAIAQIQKPADYATRIFPETKNVYQFLAHEREKVVSSYNAFVEFVRTTISADSKNEKESV